MRGQMAVMAAGVDSTMGRAGRMMPWNWWPIRRRRTRRRPVWATPASAARFGSS